MITTIIPTYRRTDRLQTAIRSVLSQTYPHFRLCIYDNASGDETAAVMQEFAKDDTRIEYTCHPTNIGAVENFQYGLDRVATPFFSFLSDDDYLFPHFYETMLDRLSLYPDAAFSIGAVFDVMDGGEVIAIPLLQWPEKEYFRPEEGLLQIIKRYSNWTGVLFRREVIEKIGKLDPEVKAIDFDYLIRAAVVCPFVITKKPCAVFLHHPNAYSSRQGFKVIWVSSKIILSKLMNHPDLSLSIKKIAMTQLERSLQKKLFFLCLRDLAGETNAIGDLYPLNQRKWLQLVLLSLRGLCHILPGFHRLLIAMLKIRRLWIRRFKSAWMQTEYEKWPIS